MLFPQRNSYAWNTVFLSKLHQAAPGSVQYSVLGAFMVVGDGLQSGWSRLAMQGLHAGKNIMLGMF